VSVYRIELDIRIDDVKLNRHHDTFGFNRLPRDVRDWSGDELEYALNIGAAFIEPGHFYECEKMPDG
jgi:hypothetical protein